MKATRKGTARKKCGHCKTEKPLTDFYKNRSNKDGLQSSCRVCCRADAQRHYAKNKEQRDDYFQEYRRTHRKEHLWGCRLQNARKHGCFILDLTPEEWDELLGRFGGLCAYCGAEKKPGQVDVGLDHMVPMCWGGQHTLSNIVPCCVRCNPSKNSKLLDEWHAPRAHPELAAHWKGRLA